MTVHDRSSITAASGDNVVTAPRSKTTRFKALQSLQVPSYRWFWLGTTASFQAMQMQQVTRGWLIYDITRSPVALALVVLSFGLPMLLLSLMGGALADRLPKRQVIIVSQVISSVTSVLIALLVLSGSVTLWHLLLTGVINGTLMAFNGPSRQAIIPEIVGRDRLVNAVGLNQAGMNITRIAGPAMAGMLIAVMGVAGVFFVMAGLYLFSALSIFKVKKTATPARDWSRWRLHKEMSAGARYVIRHPVLLSVTSVAFAAVLLGMPYQNLMPAYAVEALQLDARGLGFLMMSTGVGALVGSIVISAWGADLRRKGAALMGCLFLWSVSLVLMALSPSFLLALATLFCVGFASSVFMTLNASISQLLSTPDMYGRVMSVNSMTFGLMPLGVLPISALAQAVGTPRALLASALVMVVISMGFYVLNNRVRKLEV